MAFSPVPLNRLASSLGRRPLVRRLRTLVDDARGTIRAAAQQRLPEVADVGRRLVERLLAEPGDGRRPAINATGVLMPEWGDPAWAALAADRMFRQAATLTVPDDQTLGADEPSSAQQAPACCESRTGAAIAAWVDAEDGLVFDNLAVATLSALASLSAGRPALAARSQLGWIDRRAAVRLADLAGAANVALREIGGVNGATRADYRSAAAQPIGLILDCQPADYQVSGAVEQATLEEVAAIAKSVSAPLVALLPAAFWPDLPGHDIPGQATSGALSPSRAIAAGADLVIASGDRYLGGPPVGIVVGRRDLIARVAAHPIARVSVADRLMLAALEATLELARRPAQGEQGIPLWQMLAASPDALRSRAERLAPQLAACPRVARAEVVEGDAYRGPGKLPDDRLPDWRVAITLREGSAGLLAAELRRQSPSIWTATDGGRLILSMRSVLAADDERIAAAFGRLGS